MTMLSLSLKMEYGLKSRELVQPSLRALANIYINMEVWLVLYNNTAYFGSGLFIYIYQFTSTTFYKCYTSFK